MQLRHPRSTLKAVGATRSWLAFSCCLYLTLARRLLRLGNWLVSQTLVEPLSRLPPVHHSGLAARNSVITGSPRSRPAVYWPINWADRLFSGECDTGRREGVGRAAHELSGPSSLFVIVADVR